MDKLITHECQCEVKSEMEAEYINGNGTANSNGVPKLRRVKSTTTVDDIKEQGARKRSKRPDKP